jgi:hypothetical protein
MRKMLCAAAVVAALPLVAPTIGAQMPVTFLLSHPGQLQLSDQQVVKLAAIARRASDRHKALRASFDSLRMQFHRGGDSVARYPQLRATMEKEHEANHADLRDALAILTPDQQASAWELVSERHMIRMRHGGMDHMEHMGHMGPRRDGPGMRMRVGSIPDDGPDDDE